MKKYIFHYGNGKTFYHSTLKLSKKTIWKEAGNSATVNIYKIEKNPETGIYDGEFTRFLTTWGLN